MKIDINTIITGYSIIPEIFVGIFNHTVTQKAPLSSFTVCTVLK